MGDSSVCVVFAPFIGWIEVLIFGLARCFVQNSPYKHLYYSYDDLVRLSNTTPCASNSLLLTISNIFFYLYILMIGNGELSVWNEIFGDFLPIYLQLLSMKSRHCASCIKS